MPKQQSKKAEFKKLTAGLRDFAASLPTENEKDELANSLTAIINFLTEIQRSLGAMPTSEGAAQIEAALRKVEQFSDRAKTAPAISGLLRIPVSRPSKAKQISYTSSETASAQSLMNEMQALPIDQMRLRLMDEDAVPLRTLQALASSLGIRSAQRVGRDVLAHQVASKISNVRGYQGLRAGPSEGS